MITIRADFNRLDGRGRLVLSDLVIHEQTPFEAIASCGRPIWVADQLHLLVSENTRHLRPNHWYAGFEFVTCPKALSRIRDASVDV
jgi:hypothetical protein